jgi:hypothetical protein
VSSVVLEWNKPELKVKVACPSVEGIHLNRADPNQIGQMLRAPQGIDN